MPLHTNKQYSIAEVSTITGIDKQTLRKWEERYYLVQPLRLNNGYRVYSQSQVDTLLFAQSELQKGHTISQVAKKIHTAQHLPVTQSFYYTKMLFYADECDVEKMDELLRIAHQVLGLEPFIEELIIPLLREVGDRWESKRWSEFHEKSVSAVIQYYLMEIEHQFPLSMHPDILCACLPHEDHELPLRILSLQLRIKGFSTYVIGRSPAPGTIEALTTLKRPKIVLLSATTAIPLKQQQQLMAINLFAEENEDISFCLGGAAIFSMSEQPVYSHIHTLKDSEKIWDLCQKQHAF
ncbi:MerR family transcriptional regulator [Kurthia senegalensis]|uniref:MerR family transcriptional regulator n=1 Tax=Kurthia senegalensis TaxID=1033740 RepID=UPI000288CD4B|nr:MerR family transcriptional regulator [Kurthia senegalensis]